MASRHSRGSNADANARVHLTVGSDMRRAIFVTIGILTASAAFAHDFWLAASRWHVAPSATVIVTANVGDNIYPRSESATAAERVESLRLVGPASTLLTPKYRTVDKSLAANVTLPSPPATYMAVMVVKGRFLSMEGKAFIEYLKEEGLESLVDEVNRRGEANRKSGERYWRDAKVLIRAGDGCACQKLDPHASDRGWPPHCAARIDERRNPLIVARGRVAASNEPVHARTGAEDASR
jgi:hypothetical protein